MKYVYDLGDDTPFIAVQDVEGELVVTFWCFTEGEAEGLFSSEKWKEWFAAAHRVGGDFMLEWVSLPGEEK